MAKKIVKKTTKKIAKKIVKKTINKKSKPTKSIKKTLKIKSINSKKPISKQIITSLKQESNQLIKKTMLITEITRAYPECAIIMMTHGLYCVGCGVAMYETLEEGAKAHGMSELEIDQMIKEMNSVVNKR